MSEFEPVDLKAYIAEEVRRYKGISYPLKSSLLRRMLTGTVQTRKIHPNPNDEFCFPNIGPNYGIVTKYEHDILQARRNHTSPCFSEPLMIQKISPDGYMLLNGHHRWGAAIRMKQDKVPVEIVNLTQGADIQKALSRTKNHKRVTLDLDEVVLAPGQENVKKMHEQLRYGIPGLFHFLREMQYDIWLYSSKYYSMDYLFHLFRRYRIRIDGIVTGNVPHRPGIEDVRKKLDEVSAKYDLSVHIDTQSVLCINRADKTFRDFPLGGDPQTWSAEITDVIRTYEKESFSL